MKTRIATLALVAAFTASSAFAGGMSEPVMETEPVMDPIVVEESTGSSGGFVIPLLLVAIIAAVAAQGD